MTTWKKEQSPRFQRNKYAGYTLEELRDELRRTDLTVVELMIIQQYLDAVSNKTAVSVRQSIRADISDRIDGKPTQTVNQTIEKTPSLTIEFADMSDRKDPENDATGNNDTTGEPDTLRE